MLPAVFTREAGRDSGNGTWCAGTERSMSEMGGRARILVTGVGEIISTFAVVTCIAATGSKMSRTLSSGSWTCS